MVLPYRGWIMEFSSFQYILTTQDLQNFLCLLEDDLLKAEEGEKFISLDTEFIREKTYYPIPCLCQIAGPTQSAIIDMTLPDMDLSFLKKLMDDHRYPKVFHAARQDLEIFYQIFKTLPTPVMDTQIAAMVCNYGSSISYEKLVYQVTGDSLDKSAQQTNWLHRPLSQAQLDYAISDVTYLRSIYKFLKKMMIKKGRESWIKEEIDSLTNPLLYEFHPENSWKKLKIPSKPESLKLFVQEIAFWRETRAHTLNLSRSRLLKDEILLELASSCARNGSFRKIFVRGLPADFLKDPLFEGLDSAIQKGWERAQKETKEQTPKETLLESTQPQVLEIITALLKIVTQELGIVPRLVANQEDLIILSQPEYPPQNLKPLQGWRYEVFGKKVLGLKDGSLGLRIEGPHIKIFSIPK